MVEFQKLKNPFVVEISREFSVPIERMFEAWVDPVGLGSWLFSTPDGKNKLCEVDPREGGSFRVGEQRGNELVMHTGTYHKIDPPNQIIFSYYQELTNDDLPSNVTIDFERNGRGCIVTVTHEMDDIWSEYEESALSGWNIIFDGLNKNIS